MVEPERSVGENAGRGAILPDLLRDGNRTIRGGRPQPLEDYGRHWVLAVASWEDASRIRATMLRQFLHSYAPWP